MNQTTVKNPLLSIIIPTLQADQALRRTLATIPISDVEVVIVSGDSANSICAPQSPWIARSGIKIFFAERRGIYNAMNIGIEKSSGEFIFFCGSGDLIIPSTLRTLIEKIRQGRFSNHELIVAPVAISGPMRIRFPSLSCRPAIIHHQGCIFPRRLLDKFGFYDEGFRLHGDWDLMCRISARAGQRKFPLPICCFAPGGRSTSGENSVVTIRELTSVMLAQGNALRPSVLHLIMLTRPIYYYIRKLFDRKTKG